MPQPDATTPSFRALSSEPGQPWRLAIEISNPSASGEGPGPSIAIEHVGLSSEPTETHVEPLNATGRHDDDLMPAIDRLAQRLGLTPRGLTSIAVSVGPGGYTGLRVAVVTAKMLAHATGSRVLPVRTAAALAETLDAGAFPAVICLASKRGTAHAERIEHHGGPSRVLGLIGLNEDLDEDLKDNLDEDKAGSTPDLTGFDGASRVVADQHLPASIRDACGKLGIRIEPPTFDARAVLAAANRVEPIDPHELQPCYPRLPEAVRRWRARNPA
ncbi:MAG: tRNA (adenosine(37)-N6)-threonylcarbamoyltransferase complex dimerization subunit type 1 TsaB [Planctomycetota bacterium]